MQCSNACMLHGRACTAARPANLKLCPFLPFECVPFRISSLLRGFLTETCHRYYCFFKIYFGIQTLKYNFMVCRWSLMELGGDHFHISKQ